MPIRIYDISKKLGLENREVLAKAKQLGILAAKVASSSLDRITAEYLENELSRSRTGPDGELKQERPAWGIPVETRAPAVTTVPVVESAPVLSPTKELAPEVQQAPAPAVHPGEATLLSTTAPPILSTKSSVLPSQRQEADLPAYIKFERSIRRMLDREFPFSTLSNVLLFHSEKAQFSVDHDDGRPRNDYALEIDHILHRSDSLTDNLVVIECKNQPIKVLDERTWVVQYEGSEKNVQTQLMRHADALRAYVNPLSRGRDLQIDVLVVANDSKTQFVHRKVSSHVGFYLVSPDHLLAGLKRSQPRPMRVAQSDILNLIRLGQPLPDFGHPELGNALAYIERCRRSIDGELFRAFTPTAGRWAINGSAGMGKSVLLAYSLFVLTTNRRVQILDGKRSLADFTEEAGKINLPPLGQRGVYAFALKEKQRQVISGLYRRFVDEFAHLSKDMDLGISRPVIQLWNGVIPKDCQVLLIDEAHDISATDAANIAGWANAPGEARYLMIACDRHQKLRLVGRDEAIIDGINFSRKTKKLRLNYRNPFSVFAASLGLMFRWFTQTGPKVLPTKDDLTGGFGLTVNHQDDTGTLNLSMQNDAHPANSWSHCVEAFRTPEGALARLKQFRFRPQDVLWVRFSDEDEHFDYEQLSCFTYHNLNCAESVELTDKYIKGQDFPIVVIEGFSENMNSFNSPEDEQRMWQRRKELYICSSRATAFLFLVANPGNPAGASASAEFAEIVRQLSAPVRAQDGFPRTWQFSVLPSTAAERRRMEVFTDAAETQ